MFNRVVTAVDAMMGGVPETPCAPDNPQALALVSAGLQLLKPDQLVTADTPLSVFGEPKDLQRVLQNLNQLTLDDPMVTIEALIIKGGTVGQLIETLDKAKVGEAVRQLAKQEEKAVKMMARSELDELSHRIT